MLKKTLLIVSMLAVLAFHSYASQLTIANFSFEADALANLQDYTSGAITGWSAPGDQGVFFPSAGVYNGSGLFTDPANCCVNGRNVAYSNGGTISQVLSATLTGGMMYTLSVDIGHRFDGALGAYSIALFAGGTQLALASNPVVPVAGGFGLATVAYTSTGLEAVTGQDLEIRLITSVDAERQVNYDNVTLDATSTAPEPTSALLLLMGVGVFYLDRRRGTGR